MIIEKNFKGEKVYVSYDDDDHELLLGYIWRINQKGYVDGYLRGWSKGKKRDWVRMHRVIMREEAFDVHIDHIDGNKLNNRKVNLRRCNASQNHMNYFVRNKITGYFGVSMDRINRPSGKTDIYFSVRIRTSEGRKRFGVYKTALEAAHAHDKYAKLHHTEFATLNFPTL